MRIPTAPIVAAGLIGGYLIARETKVRPLGGAVLAVNGAAATALWQRDHGPAVAGGLLALYLGGFGASHPLAKKIGAWPAVLSVAALSAGASALVADRRPPRVR